jgi:hypothetical protein
MFDLLTTLIFLARWIVLPVYLTGSLTTVLQITPMFLVAGYYFSFFISLSHNFKGVHLLDDTTRQSNRQGKENSFLYKQGRNSPIVKHYS